MVRSSGDGPSPAGDTLVPPDLRRRRLVIVATFAVLLALSAAWAVAALQLIRSQESRQAYETQLLSDTRYYDELLTMSANMAAQTGADAWVERYRRGEAALAASLRTVLDNVPDDQVAAVLATDAANQALVAIEVEALAAVEAGDLARAQSLLASARYADLKGQYAASVTQATAWYEETSRTDQRQWTWLLWGQFLISVITVVVVGLLGWWLMRATRFAAAAVVARREAELRASEELFRRAMQESSVGMALVSPDGRMAEVNPALCRLTGRDAEVLRSMTWLELLPADELVTAQDSVGPLLRGEADQLRTTGRLRHADGSLRLADVSVSGIHAADGSLEYLLTQLVDVTEQARMSQALADSEQRFRLMAELAADVILTTDADGTVDWVSPSVHDVLGWDPQTLLGRPARDLTHPQDLPDLTAAFLGDAGPDRPRELRARYATPDGRWRWMGVSGRLVTDDEGEVTGARVSLHDITGEVESRQALEASERRFRMLAENATDLIYQTDIEGTITWVAPTVTRGLGWQPDDLLGRSASDLLHVDDLGTLEGMAAAALDRGPDAGSVVPGTLVLVSTSAGDSRWMSARVTALREPDGTVTGHVVAMEDVDALVRAREDAERARREVEEARREEQNTRVSMDSAPIGMALTGLDGRFTRVNPALSRMLGYRAEEMVGMAFQDVTHPDDAGPGVTALADLVAGRIDSFSQRKRYLTRDGAAIWIDLTVAPARSPDGALQHFVAQVVDVNAEVTTFDALQRSMQQYRMLAENASDVVYQTDAQGILRWVSPSIASVLGWDPEVLLGTRATALIAPEDLAEVNRHRATVYAGDPVQGVPARFRTVDGEYRDMSVNAHRVTSPDGTVVGAVVALRDVTAEVAAQRELARRARTDALTGLLNRAEILARLKSLLDDRRRDPVPFAVAFVDIDRLKAVNDEHGHATGDALITTVADRIRSCTRAGDLTGRLGGDELLVVLTEVGDDRGALAAAEKIRQAVAHPARLTDATIDPTVSIGVTLAAPSADVDEVIARADQAMYRAKTAGRDAVVLLE